MGDVGPVVEASCIFIGLFRVGAVRFSAYNGGGLMYANVKKYIIEQNLWQVGDKILVAVSGGMDSMCLLYLLQMMAKQKELQIYVCHVNHSLRLQESERDAEFVEQYCKMHNLNFEICVVDVRARRKKGMSIEQAARELRYEILHSIKERLEYDYIATAHNKNDQAETFFINMLRGAGLAGLSGMLPKNKDIVRPLLGISRDDIEEFCVKEGIKYCYDSSNDCLDYLRNNVRKRLLPYVKEYNPNILTTLTNNMENIRYDSLYLDNVAREKAEQILEISLDGIVFKKNAILKLPRALQVRVLNIAINNARNNVYGISFQHFKMLLNGLTECAPGRVLKLPGVLVEISTEKVRIKSSVENKEALDLITINDIGEYKFGNLVFKVDVINEKNNILHHSDKVLILPYYPGCNLSVRTRREGDFFYLKTGNKKSIKNFFIDAKIPVFEREQIPLVFYDNILVWVVGYRKNYYNLPKNEGGYLTIEFYKGE